MSNNNMINDKKKALLAYKEKILEEIKYYERSIDDFRANHKSNSFYEDQDSSDSEDDFLTTIDTGPSIQQLKLQQAMMKTCLQATQELTSLTVLQSEVNVLVEDPKFEKEKPVTEAGTWREVTAECRIDLVPFTIYFYMHTPDRKFGPPSYRGLRVVPVKYPHEMELAKSVLHSLKLPSDAVEVLRNYAVGYRSRRTTLARLANKYANALFMEPHAEGGFVLKCADLLEVSWRLENKWSPVAPFHHRMKFDLEYMDEAYIKIITQAHKQLLDPSIETDERTLLLAKIITTCLEVRGPIDLESDLESKTTERDNDIDKRDRDSEVMAPPKTLPKKVRQKNKDSTNAGQKRTSNDDIGDDSAKKMKSGDINTNNVRKSKLNEPAPETSKKRKIHEAPDKVNKVASIKNVKEASNTEDGDDKLDNVDAEAKRSKNIKESDKNENKTKSKAINNDDTTANKDINTKKTKSTKESMNTEVKTKNQNGDGDAPIKNAKTKPKNAKDMDNNTQNDKTKNKNGDGDAATKNINAKPKSDGNIKTKNKNNIEHVEEKGGNKIAITKNKNKLSKDPTNATKNKPKEKSLNIEKENNTNNVKGTNLDNDIKTKTKIPKEDKNINTKKPKNIVSKDSGNLDNQNETENAKNKNIDPKKPKTISKVNMNAKKTEIQNNTETAKVANTKNSEANANKAKIKQKNVATTKTDEPTNKIPKIANKPNKPKTANVYATQTIKKVTEKNAIQSKTTDKISPIVSEQNVKEKPTSTEDEAPEKVTIKKTKDIINKEIIKKPIKTIKNLTQKIASHRTALKVQNPQKINTGNTKVLKPGNTEKENGGKVTKIPMKKLSPISEGSSKKNLLRISPRKIPSKFKTSNSQATVKQKIVKSTNIPRLMTKPVSKTTSLTTIK